MTASVRFDYPDDDWRFGDHRRSFDSAFSLVITHDDLEAATATDLARALRRARRYDVEPQAVLIDLGDPEEYEPQRDGLVDSVSFVLLEDGRLAIRCGLSTDEGIDDERSLAGELLSLVGPFLQRCNAHLVSVHVEEEHPKWASYHALVATSTRSKNLQDLYDIGKGLITIVDASTAGHLTRETVTDLILCGRADLLIGLPEGPWLDAKQQHYDLTTERGRNSLAKSVSRFANAEEGGVVVYGLATKKVPGGERIKAIQPVSLTTAISRQYRQALENHLFPLPKSLTIDSVEVQPGQGLMVISLPPQPEELKPFLVHGALVDGKYEGAYIGIVRRSGEDSIPVTAQQIHSTLVAGRALLRRGEIPNIS